MWFLAPLTFFLVAATAGAYVKKWGEEKTMPIFSWKEGQAFINQSGISEVFGWGQCRMWFSMVISDLRAGSTKYFDVLILPGHLLFSCAHPLLSDGLEAELLFPYPPSCGFSSFSSRLKWPQLQSCSAWEFPCVTPIGKFLPLWNPLSSEVKPGIHLACKSAQKNAAIHLPGQKSTLNVMNLNFHSPFTFWQRSTQSHHNGLSDAFALGCKFGFNWT